MVEIVDTREDSAQNSDHVFEEKFSIP